MNRQLDNIFEPPGQNELIVQSVFFFRLTRPTDSDATLTLKYAKPILRKKATVLQSIARAISLCNFLLFLLLLTFWTLQGGPCSSLNSVASILFEQQGCGSPDVIIIRDSAVATPSE